MTVLVYRDGIIAADRRITWEEAIQAPACKLKIGRSKNWKYVAGFAGDSEDDEVMMAVVKDLVETNKKPAQKFSDLSILIVAVPINPTGKRKLINLDADNKGAAVITYRGKTIPPYFALGSGQQTALGSMRGGRCALDAVRDVSHHVTSVGDGLNYVDTNLPLNKWRVRERGAAKKS